MKRLPLNYGPNLMPDFLKSKPRSGILFHSTGDWRQQVHVHLRVDTHIAGMQPSRVMEAALAAGCRRPRKNNNLTELPLNSIFKVSSLIRTSLSSLRAINCAHDIIAML